VSIYCSYFGFGDEHKNSCARIKRVGRRIYEQDDSRPCTCGNAPIIYQASNVLPSNKDKRGGSFGISAIPRHISRKGRRTPRAGAEWHSWLRVHLNTETTILTRKQAQKLYKALGMWLKDSAPAHPKETQR
jgi:hypothetical protein